MSLATIWEEIEADARAAIAAVEGGVEKLAEEIGTVVVSDAEAVLKQLYQLSIAAVLAEAPKAISGSEKFGNAVANIIQAVEAQGKAVIVSNAQAAVQSVYNAVKLAVSPAQ